jgi:hypothetical protein
VETWVIPSGSALHLPPPAAARAAAEIQWVKESEANLIQAQLQQIAYSTCAGTRARSTPPFPLDPAACQPFVPFRIRRHRRRGYRLTYLFPDRASTLSQMENQAAQSRILAGVAFPSGVFGGIDMGTEAGQAVIAYAGTDGSNQVFTGSFPVMAGVWSSPNPR